MELLSTTVLNDVLTLSIVATMNNLCYHDYHCII